VAADLPQPSSKKHGQAAGVANYSANDVDALLTILEEHLPLGGQAWATVGDEFNKWAEENGRPNRTAKSLEHKYKQVRHRTLSYIPTFDFTH
jgi:hypothetical protein